MAAWNAEEGAFGLVLNKVKKLRLGCTVIADGRKASRWWYREIEPVPRRADGPVRMITTMDGLGMMSEADIQLLRDDEGYGQTEFATNREMPAIQ